MSCSSRTFYRGAAFAATDERHIVGATIARPDPTANAAACLSEGGLELLYHASPLAIIHFQVGSLNDLVMRVMRQAARLSPSRCNQKDRPHLSSEVKELRAELDGRPPDQGQQGAPPPQGHAQKARGRAA